VRSWGLKYLGQKVFRLFEQNRISVLYAALFFTLIACRGSGNIELLDGGYGLNIEIVSGNNQEERATRTYENALVVRVSDKLGYGVKGVEVEFSEVTNEGAKLSDTLDTTNEEGTAKISVKAPALYDKEVVVQAKITGSSSKVLFNLKTKEAGNVSRVALETTNNGIETAGVPFRFTLKVLDDTDNVIANYSENESLSWTVQAGNGWDGTAPSGVPVVTNCAFIEGICVVDFDTTFAHATTGNANDKTLVSVGFDTNPVAAVFNQEITVLKGAPERLVIADKSGGPSNGAVVLNSILTTADCYRSNPDDGKCYKNIGVTNQNQYSLNAAVVDARGNYVSDPTTPITWSGTQAYTSAPFIVVPDSAESFKAVFNPTLSGPGYLQNANIGKIQASAASLTTGQIAQVIVDPGTPHHISISKKGSGPDANGISISPGVPFSIEVYAQDYHGNILAKHFDGSNSYTGLMQATIWFDQDWTTPMPSFGPGSLRLGNINHKPGSYGTDSTPDNAGKTFFLPFFDGVSKDTDEVKVRFHDATNVDPKITIKLVPDTGETLAELFGQTPDGRFAMQGVGVPYRVNLYTSLNSTITPADVAAKKIIDPSSFVCDFSVSNEADPVETIQTVPCATCDQPTTLFLPWEKCRLNDGPKTPLMSLNPDLGDLKFFTAVEDFAGNYISDAEVTWENLVLDIGSSGSIIKARSFADPSNPDPNNLVAINSVLPQRSMVGLLQIQSLVGFTGDAFFSMEDPENCPTCNRAAKAYSGLGAFHHYVAQLHWINPDNSRYYTNLCSGGNAGGCANVALPFEVVLYPADITGRVVPSFENGTSPVEFTISSTGGTSSPKGTAVQRADGTRDYTPEVYATINGVAEHRIVIPGWRFPRMIVDNPTNCSVEINIVDEYADGINICPNITQQFAEMRITNVPNAALDDVATKDYTFITGVTTDSLTIGANETVTLYVNAYDAEENILINPSGYNPVSWTGTYLSNGLDTNTSVPAFTSVTLDPDKTGTGELTYTYSNGQSGGSVTTNPITVIAGPLDHFEVVSEDVTLEEDAGVPFDLTVTMEDMEGNVITGTPGDVSKTLNFNIVGAYNTIFIGPTLPTSGVPYTFDDGVLVLSGANAVTLVNSANTQSVQVTSVEAVPKTGLSGDITVKHGPFDMLYANPGGVSISRTVNNSVTWNVSALDAYGNTIADDAAIDAMDVTVTLSRLAADDPSAQIVSETFAAPTVPLNPASDRAFTGKLVNGVAEFIATTKQAGALTATLVGDPALPNPTLIYGVTYNPDAATQFITVIDGQVHKQGVDDLATAVTPTQALDRTAGEVFAITVKAVDQFFNTVTSTNGNTVSLNTQTDNQTVAAPNIASGVSVTNISHSVTGSQAGGKFYIDPTVSGGLPVENSSKYNVLASTPTKVVFATAPSMTVEAGVNFPVQPVVEVQDANSNVVPGSTVEVTLTPHDEGTCSSFTSGNLLANDLSPAAVDGVATFGAVKFTRAQQLWIKASASGLAPDCVGPIAVSAAAATQIIVVLPGQTYFPGISQTLGSAVFLTPTTQTAGVEYADFAVVRAVDDYFNTDANYVSSLTLTTSDSNDTDPAAVNFSSGVAQFKLTHVTAGTSHTLVPSSGSLTPRTSSNFVVQHGTPTKIIVKLPGQTHVPGKSNIADALTGTVTTQSITSGFSVEVLATDAYHNKADAATGAVQGNAISITTSDANDSEPAASTFNGGAAGFVVSNRTSGTGQTITPVYPTGGLTLVASSGYTVNPGAAAQLLVKLPGQTHNPGVNGTAVDAIVNPVGGVVVTAGDAYEVQVLATDVNFNIVTTYSESVSLFMIQGYDLSFQTPTAQTFTNGVATFATNIAVPVKNYSAETSIKLSVSGSSLTANNSSLFQMQPGPATKLLSLLPNENRRPGATSLASSRYTLGNFDPQVNVPFTVEVHVVDAFYNRVDTATGDISITTTDTADVHDADEALGQAGHPGEVYFTVTPKSTGTFKAQFTQSVGGSPTLTGLDTNNYSVDAAAPDHLFFATMPSATATTTADFAQWPIVHVRDAANNIVTGYNSTVTLSLFTNSLCTDAATGLSSATSPLMPTNGVASFTNFSYRKAEEIWFKATSGALTSGCTASSSVVAPGTATQIIAILPTLNYIPGVSQNSNAAITGTPDAQTTGGPFSVVVRAVDDWFNTVNDNREVQLSTNDPRDTNPTALNLSNGVRSFTVTNTTSTSSGVTHFVTPSSTDGQLTSVNSKNYTVNVGTATQLLVLLPGQSAVPGTQGAASSAVTGSISTLTAGTAFDVRVQAVDAYFNKVAAHAGTATLAMAGATDAAAVFPGATNFSSGEATLSVTNKTASLVHALRPTSSTSLSQNDSTTYTVNSSGATRLIALLPNQNHVQGTANCVGGIVNSPTTQNVGTAFNVTIKAVDSLCNTDLAYDSASIQVASSDPNDTNPGAVAMNDGSLIASLTNTTATSSGVTHNVTATYVSGPVSVTTATSADYTVNALAASRLIAILPGQSYNPGVQGNIASAITVGPDPQEAGTSFDVVLRAVDTYWNTDPSYGGTLSLTLSQGTDTNMVIAGSGVPATSGTTTVTVTHKKAANSSPRRVVTLAGYELRPAGTSIASFNSYDTSEYVVNPSDVLGLMFVLENQTHTEGAANLAAAVTPNPPSNRVAGEDYQVQLKAVDAFFNTVETYSGSATVTSSDTADTNPGVQNLATGQVDFAHTNLTASSGQTLAADSGDIADASSSTFTVAPNSANYLDIAIQPSADESTTSNFAYSPSVIVRDAFNNQVTSSTDLITMEAFTNAACTTPITGAFGATQNPKPASGGAATFSGIFYRAAEDIYLKFSSGSLTTDCTSAEITVLPGATSQIAVKLPGQTFNQGVSGYSNAIVNSATAQNAAAAYNVEVYATDEYFNRTTHTTTSTPADISLQLRETGSTTWEGNTPDPTKLNFANGLATFSVEHRTVGTWRWFVSSDSVASRHSSNVTVNPGVPTQSVVLLPAQSLLPGKTSLGASLQGAAPNQTAGVSFTLRPHILDLYFNIVSTLSDTAAMHVTKGVTKTHGIKGLRRRQIEWNWVTKRI